MDMNNRAQGAPRGSFAHIPTGFRRMTPGLLKVDRAAESFAGLPEGVKSPGQLLTALKAAAPRLAISPRIVHAVDWLFRFTQPQDWEKGRRPIVWPSASMQEEALGLSATQVKEINRRLIELGLITMRDSPNGKRYGRRHEKTGHIIEAYGFDLAPLAARHTEFVLLAERGGWSAPRWGGCGGGRRSPGRPLPRSSRQRRNTVSRARSGSHSLAKHQLSCAR